MTKFFAQLLLSLMVGLGAAATFDADVKDTLAQSLDRTRAFVWDATHTELEQTGSIDLTAGTEVDDRGEAEAELGVDAEADTRLNRLVRGIPKWFDEANAETTLTAESETDAEADSGEASLDLGNDLGADLELDLGLGD